MVCGERLKARGVGDIRRRGCQRMRWTDSITNSVDMTLSKLPEIVKDRGARWAIVHGVTKSWTWLSDWTTTTSLWHPLTPGSKDRRRLSLGEAVTCAGEILQGRNQGMNAPSFLILCLLSWYLLSRYQSPSTSQGDRGPRLMHIIEVTQGFPGGSDGKESTYNAGDPGSIPGLGRSPWRGEWQPTPIFLPEKIPSTEEPDGWWSMGSQRAGHNWATNAFTSLYS